MRTSTLLAFVLLLPSLAHAEVLQPNGAVMPQDSMNGEVQLFTLFSGRGEAIDYRADGASMPAVFSPLCDFRATFVLNEAGSHFGLAWYNADAADTTPPTGAELHVIVPAGAAVGTVVTSADIRSDGAYAGGLIGFALVGGQTHYSEARYNVVCTACSAPGPWIMAVIYASRTIANAYYVAFEDGNVTESSFNNDGDYNDDVFLLEGLVCAGGGEDCDTGMPGICSAGLTECTAAGMTCRTTVAPRTETCNGLDDDCNGSLDDGDLCPTGEICDRGVCVGRCMGEFGCSAGLDCNAGGFCVEPMCAAVTCPAGEVCRAGTCTGPCTGVVCPGDEVCRAGRCVDACAGVTCDSGRVCDRGVCRAACDCAPCAVGLTCEPASGACRDASCIGVACGAGMVCRAGGCVDACTGAVCPRGQVCSMGECIDDATFGTDAGGTDGGGVGGDGGGRMDGSTGRGPTTGGCGCATDRHDGGALFVLLVLAVLAWRRRK